MPLPGKAMEPREIARLCHEAGWRDLELVKAVAVCLSESAGYPLAYHDNAPTDWPMTIAEVFELMASTGELDAAGDRPSRDVGLFQINIPYEKVGTPYEKDLYAVVANIARARGLYETRGWQPWYGFTNGYALSTDWYRPDGKASGRYLMKALRGVANFQAEHFKVSPVPLFKRPSPPKP